ncbi:MAG: sugar phosphate isomerase/epimerase family protein [Chloroflexota bacterium]
MKQNRREFISTMAAAGAAIPFLSVEGKGYGAQQESKYPIRLFSKPIDAYDFGFMCEVTSKCGIGGFDMTVRPGGKIVPEKVETDLPKLVAEAKKYNLVFDMMVTAILSASDPFTDRILKTASSSGVKYYRFGWADYDLKAGIMDSIKKYHNELVAITALNKKYRIAGSYQNHAGPRLGGPVWDLYELLKDLPREYTGAQYDVRHAMVEGANTWLLGMRLIADKINTLAIKDFIWQNVKGKAEAVTVPMGEGMVNWDAFFQIVKELKIVAPLTLHIEYPLLEKGEEKLSLTQQQEIIVRKIKKDTDFVKSYLKKYQLA